MNQIDPCRAVAEQKAIAEKLTCVFCDMMVTKPYHKCPQCSKNHCMNCEGSLPQKSKCGICSSQTYLQKHDDLLVEMKFHCRNDHCKKVFDFSSILRHEATCNKNCSYCSKVLEREHKCFEKLEKQQKDSDLLILKMLSLRAQGTYFCGDEKVELKCLNPRLYRVVCQRVSADCQVALDVEKGKASLDSKAGLVVELDLNQTENLSLTLKKVNEHIKVFGQRKGSQNDSPQVSRHPLENRNEDRLRRQSSRHQEEDKHRESRRNSPEARIFDFDLLCQRTAGLWECKKVPNLFIWIFPEHKRNRTLLYA